MSKKKSSIKQKTTMTKRNKIIYWIATIWLAVAMIASGIQQIFTIGGFVEIMKRAYPTYIRHSAFGKWQVLVLLIPKFPLLKEWAYAGFFFAMSGAIFLT